MKVKIHYTEAFNTYLVRKGVEIDTDDYPELKGMSEDEVLEYINEYSDDMDQTVEGGYYSSLYEELSDQDVIKDKITGVEVELIKARN